MPSNEDILTIVISAFIIALMMGSILLIGYGLNKLIEKESR